MVVGNVPGHEGVAPPSQVRVHLPGDWVAIPARDPKAARTALRSFASRSFPPGDEYAPARAALQERLKAVVSHLDNPSLEGVFVCREIAKGVPVPLFATVMAPPDLVMTPSPSERPRDVAAMFARAMTARGEQPFRDAAVVETPDSAYVRVHRVVETRLGDDEAAPTSRSLEVEYWFAEPASKRMVNLAFHTSFGEIVETMLMLCDAIAGTVKFVRA